MDHVDRTIKDHINKRTDKRRRVGKDSPFPRTDGTNNDLEVLVLNTDIVPVKSSLYTTYLLTMG